MKLLKNSMLVIPTTVITVVYSFLNLLGLVISMMSHNLDKPNDTLCDPPHERFIYGIPGIRVGCWLTDKV